jgi:uncharacterized protein (UPF0335 family)
MEVNVFFRNGEAFKALSVTKKDIIDIYNKCPYISISEEDKKLFAQYKDDEIVGALFGNIGKVLNDLGLTSIEENLFNKEDPSVWFVNKNFLNDKYKTKDSKFSFGEILDLLKNEVISKAARKGWNGKGMWITYVPASIVTINKNTPYAKAGLEGKEITIEGHLDMFTAKGTMQPGWLASQADMLSNDWVIIGYKMAKKDQRVISEAEAKEILEHAAAQIQLIDERIEQLKEDRKEIIKNIKDQGLNVKALNQAIRRVRSKKSNLQPILFQFPSQF